MSENEDSLFFNSDFFDEDLFENIMIQKKSEKATKTQKLELLEFIGGFEKWEFLPDDCKMYIIGLLNYWTRCQLSLCSKKDNEFVKNTILCITEGVSAKNNGINMRPRNLAALCKSDYEQNYREQAAVHKIIMNPEDLKIEKLGKLKYLKIKVWKPESVEFWLSRLNPEIALEELILQCWEDVLKFEHLAYPSILNAASFFVPENIVMSDEQFLRMSNRKSLYRADTLSSKVLMEFLAVISVQSKEKKRAEINFLKQACLQAFVFVCELITYFIITPKLDPKNRWLCFSFTSLAWVLNHHIDIQLGVLSSYSTGIQEK
ncbi:unnamed protein product [Caenorhabditis nigoni]